MSQAGKCPAVSRLHRWR